MFRMKLLRSKINLVCGLGIFVALILLYSEILPAMKTKKVIFTRAVVNEVSETQTVARRKNVLFLMADDLRPQLNCYGDSNPITGFPIHSPHLDALAARSLLLKKAYVQLSMCGPSRASLLTGRRPDTTQVWLLRSFWRDLGGNFTTIPQFFKENGYITAGLGKVFHPYAEPNADDPISWTEPYFQPDMRPFRKLSSASWRAYSADELKQTPHPDQLIADATIVKLRELAVRSRKTRENFFLAVGFNKPHLPFSFPEEFLRFYPWKDMDTAENPHFPVDYPKTVYSKPGELLTKSDISVFNLKGEWNATMPRKSAKSLRRAYSACVSFMDHLVGRVLEELKELGLEDDTVVSFIGDHGWHLGENGMWGKHTNMEQGTLSPMMLHIPGRTDTGVVSKSIVEFVDLFPTLAEAAGLEAVPECPDDSSQVKLCTEGLSFLPLIDNPELTIKRFALSQHKHVRHLGMGYSIRGENFRYTEWPQITRTPTTTGSYDIRIMWGRLAGAELYDHRSDPGENVNRAEDPKYREHRVRLSRRLRQMVGDTIKDFKDSLDDFF